MAASIADVLEVLRNQVKANADTLIILNSIADTQKKLLAVLEEIRDDGGFDAGDDEDDDEDAEGEGDQASAGFDDLVDGVAEQVRSRIREKGISGLFRRRKPKVNGSTAPKEAAGPKET